MLIATLLTFAAASLLATLFAATLLSGSHVDGLYKD